MNNIFGNPCLEKVGWRIIGGWARSKINCCLSGILNECGGCCHSRTIEGKKWNAENVYPMRSFGSIGYCEHFTENGCKFDISDRPLLCLLYPFYVNDKNDIVIYWRVLGKGGSCKPAYKTQDKTIFEHFRDTFVEIFGEYQYNSVYEDLIINTRSFSYFYPSDKIQFTYNEECKMFDSNIKPINRKEIYERYNLQNL